MNFIALLSYYEGIGFDIFSEFMNLMILEFACNPKSVFFLNFDKNDNKSVTVLKMGKCSNTD